MYFDPWGLDACDPEWHHALPKDVFLDKNGNPVFEGIDPNNSEFGRIMQRDDHRGGKQTGSPSNKTLHNEYNRHWKEWIQAEQDAGRAITRDSVLAHLAEIESNAGGKYSKFSSWLGQGVQAEHSYSTWNGQDSQWRQKWYQGKLTAAQAAARQALSDLKAAGSAVDGAAAMRTFGRALKAIGFIGAAAAILGNAQDVYAGDKSLTEGVHDVINPFITAEEARMLGDLERERWHNWRANKRSGLGIHNPGRIDRGRAPVSPGEQPFPGERQE